MAGSTHDGGVDIGFLRSLPKCEHHLHIEGSLSPHDLFTLAQRNGISLPDASLDPSYTSAETLAQRYKAFNSLDDFLSYYYRGMSVLLTSADFDTLTFSYLRRAHSEGVQHAELFFDPQAHVARGVSVATVLAGMRSACTRAEAELGISTLLVPCFLRHLPANDALAVLNSNDFASAVAEKEIVGIGLDSSESGFPPELFAEVYAEAKKLGLHLTAHAGEEGPPANVADSLDMLRCERIDHGVRMAEDPDLTRRVARDKVLVTVCPLSNVALRVVKHVRDLPIRIFLEQGVRFSINSDDPEYLGGYILDSYVAVQEAFNLSRQEWKLVCRHAIEGSWCDQARKAVLIAELDAI